MPAVKQKADTLVLYIFSNTDSEYENNLLFFLKHAVREGDGCDYVIVIQTGGKSKVTVLSSMYDPLLVDLFARLARQQLVRD